MYHKRDTLVRCDWMDAWCGNTWRDHSEITNKPIAIRSVGYVVKHDKTGLSMAATKDSGGTYNGVMFRPRAMIKKIKVLRDTDK